MWVIVNCKKAGMRYLTGGKMSVNSDEILKTSINEINALKSTRKSDYLKKIVSPVEAEYFPQIWGYLARKFAKVTAVKDPYRKPYTELTFEQTAEAILDFAAGLQCLGVKQSDKVSIFSENCSRWLIADQAILLTGAVDAVRGFHAPAEELAYIVKHSESRYLILENVELYKKIESHIQGLPLSFIGVLWSPEGLESITNAPCPVYSFEEIIEFGKKNDFVEPSLNKESPATIIYTSGTTGMPKGALLTHGNLLHQINALINILHVEQGHVDLAILPIWHAYERSCKYYITSRGGTLVYTNPRCFKQDIQTYKPESIIAVPRLWSLIYDGMQAELRKKPAIAQFIINSFINTSVEFVICRRRLRNFDIDNINPSPLKMLESAFKTVFLYPVHKLGNALFYSKIRKATGGNFKFGISGGGALPKQIDDFFEVLGLGLVVGYGLTETAPILTVRYPSMYVSASVGPPLTETEIKIVDPETFKPLPVGQKGLVMIRGPQLMEGYYKNEEATNKVISPDRWFNTGDIGWLTPNNHLVLTGREKDIIVLSNGEKVEPTPVEDACVQSPYISQIMLVGQDEKALGALIVPDENVLKNALSIPENQELDLSSKKVTEIIRQELNNRVKNRPNFTNHERIGQFKLLKEPFTIENGLLTQTMKIRRNKVNEKYSFVIEELFKDA